MFQNIADEFAMSNGVTYLHTELLQRLPVPKDGPALVQEEDGVLRSPDRSRNLLYEYNTVYR